MTDYIFTGLSNADFIAIYEDPFNEFKEMVTKRFVNLVNQREWISESIESIDGIKKTRSVYNCGYNIHETFFNIFLCVPFIISKTFA